MDNGAEWIEGTKEQHSTFTKTYQVAKNSLFSVQTVSVHAASISSAIFGPVQGYKNILTSLK